MTITHPCHPLCGQQVEVICIPRSATPQIAVRLPDGIHVQIPLDWTDYAALPATERDPPADPAHLLNLDGLRQVVQLIDHIRRDDRDNASQDEGGTYNEVH